MHYFYAYIGGGSCFFAFIFLLCQQYTPKVSTIIIDASTVATVVVIITTSYVAPPWNFGELVHEELATKMNVYTIRVKPVC